MNTGERLEYIRNKIGLNRVEFAEKTGTTPYKIENIEKGKQQNIPIELAERIKEVFDINFEWILTGHGDPFSGSSADTVKIPVDYQNKGSCGAGATVDDNIRPDYIQLSRFWLKNVLRASLTDLLVIFARGDSMEPTIQDGDMLLVDKTQIDLCDGIYLVRFYNELVVKRVYDVKFEIRLASDNPRYDYIPVQKENFGSDKQAQIIGKVIWNGSKKTV